MQIKIIIENQPLDEGTNMATEQIRFEKKLHELEISRRNVASRLDRSYLQDNVSELLALEEKYERIMYQIGRIKDLVASGKRITAT